MLSVICSECHLCRVSQIRPFADCHYAECRSAKCLYAECHYAICCGAEKVIEKYVLFTEDMGLISISLNYFFTHTFS